MVDVRITFDREADAAYIYLAEIRAGRVARTVSVEMPDDYAGKIIALDFDADRRLLGIEVLDARSTLPPSIVEHAEAIG